MDAEGRLRSGVNLAIFVAVVLAVGGVSVAVASWAHVRFGGLSLADIGFLAPSLAWLVATATATYIGCKVARRDASWPRLRDPRAARHLLLGLAAGAGIVAFAVLVPWAAGAESLAGPGSASAAAIAWAGAVQFAMLAPQSVAEELLLRGFALRELERGVGQRLAVLITSSLFGVMHLLNPGASYVAALNIALVGALFALIVIATGSLYASIGVHIAWNWCEGFVFGHPVSGLAPGLSLLHRAAAVPGRELWTGGEFGPEASVPTAVLMAAGIAILLAMRTKTK
jgi:membrane protease YdiL (CAAX protease family)